MKYYPRDPARAIEGMQGLTLEQRGAYNTILDHLYARDNVLPDDDAMLARMMRVNVQRWRRLKSELMKAGKIRVTIDGLLTANGVEVTMILTSSRSVSARKSATLRWENYRKTKEINGTAMRHRNATKTKDIKTSTNLEVSSNDEAPVDDEDNFGEVKPHSTLASGELEAVIRAKGWK